MRDWPAFLLALLVAFALWYNLQEEEEARGRYVGRGSAPDCELLVLAGPFRPGEDVLDFVHRIAAQHEGPGRRHARHIQRDTRLGCRREKFTFPRAPNRGLHGFRPG